MDRKVIKHPAVEACRVIVDVIKRGSPTEGSNELWRDRGANYHIRKALGHLWKWDAEQAGKAPDGENHIHNALTRLAMAICCEQKAGIESATAGQSPEQTAE